MVSQWTAGQGMVPCTEKTFDQMSITFDGTGVRGGGKRVEMDLRRQQFDFAAQIKHP